MLKTGPSSAIGAHKAGKVVREDGDFDLEVDTQVRVVADSKMLEIPDAAAHQHTPSLLPILLPETGGGVLHVPETRWTRQGYDGGVQQQTPPWEVIHQRILNWAIAWPIWELDAVLGSTARGQQVNETSLSIWVTQAYKRYVRSQVTESPPGRVDRLFVPPNVADAINTAVFNGRHRDACMMLRELWESFGLGGFPRLLIVLAKHRTDTDHCVVHRCVCGPF